ncbi:MAG: trehalose-phosphatase [Solirubrobacterales bacterium]|nr:trehalose-phosphatase [Solirubrobacterales bacterium]
MGTSDSVLTILLEEPSRSALLTDVDGTLCRIVERPDRARVPAVARDSLETLADHLGLVACVTGRPTRTARKLVGTDRVTYFGNHGLGLLHPGEEEPFPVIEEEKRRLARDFIRENDDAAWVVAKIRIEDKGSIQALHWRGADGRTEDMVHGIAERAERSGLDTHWGRKVLELRPPGMAGKAGAVDSLLEGSEWPAVAFAGDDRTDLEAAIRLRELQEEGRIDRLAVVAIASNEGPDELVEMADLVLDEPEQWIAMLVDLARLVQGEPDG